MERADPSERSVAVAIGQDPLRDVEALFDLLIGPSGRTEYSAVFGHREVVQAVPAQAGGGRPPGTSGRASR